ncbi:hypothetical protein N7462_006134 [Penicillium macrosclerotiorum]|uniref:uncharacterized protein n=1 Tax=Penicillium macrosclerotiorum TaxID=303699 RepID=UPI002547F07E|nr:uncharacterized protein N7462_006134 [Penicillium macrosclerotiorum]KAJ5682969.1 hypothetical protein N7462_006134 [Penicillium macrosclerotiorum]
MTEDDYGLEQDLVRILQNQTGDHGQETANHNPSNLSKKIDELDTLYNQINSKVNPMGDGDLERLYSSHKGCFNLRWEDVKKEIKDIRLVQTNMLYRIVKSEAPRASFSWLVKCLALDFPHLLKEHESRGGALNHAIENNMSWFVNDILNSEISTVELQDILGWEEKGDFENCVLSAVKSELDTETIHMTKRIGQLYTVLLNGLNVDGTNPKSTL